LVKGRDDLAELTDAYQVVVAIVLLLALVAAAFALGFAAYAAQGTPKDLHWPTGDKLRVFERNAAVTAKKRLRYSRILTFVTVGLLALGVGLTWFGEAKPPDTTAPSLLVVSPTIGATCGSLALNESGAVVLTQSDGAQVPIDPTVGTQVVVVPSCPSP
jgi:hypothetical protein